uniref:non-specific serine/threonine protein kinase n=1 Tax=Leersia perrieri TaxID=77586 RepID=A0A0D9XHV5_9ORYZ
MAAFVHFIAIAVLLSSSLASAVTGPPGTIERVVKQQILASIPPSGHPPVLFLTSPSGKYAAYFVRSHTVPGAGGLGADFCYVEVVATKAGASVGDGEAAAMGVSVWESECRPVSTVNTCTLLFSWHGLEVFDGSQEVWHGETNTDGTNFLQRLELVDDGDMRIRDKDGELAWRASDEPRHAQHCGAPGSPGLATAFPPFAEPIGAHSSDLPFGMFPGGNGRAGAAVLPEATDLGTGAIGGAGVVAPLPGAMGGDAAAFSPLPGAVGGDAAAVAPVAGDIGGGDAAALAPLPGALGGDAAAFAPLPGYDQADPAAAAGVAAGVGGVGAGAATGAFGSQPLVDNSPYDSAAWKISGHLAAIVVALCVSVIGAI